MSSCIVFLGPPASGKGTQGRRLADELGLKYFSTGAFLRAAMRGDSALGLRVRPFLERGQFVPDEIMVPMVLEWVDSQGDGVLLDGFPRTVQQAQDLDESAEGEVRAIVLEVFDEELRRRVSCRLECESCHWVVSGIEESRCPQCGGRFGMRADDVRENFEKRLLEYRRLVVPTIRYYRDKERIKMVDGMGSLEEVYARVKD